MIKVTREYFLTDSFRELWKKLDEDERSHVGEVLDFYVKEFERVKAEHGDEPINVAATLHAIIEDEIAREREKNPHASKISCSKGCSYCCEHFVGIMPIEAELLRAYATELGLAIDEARLRRQVGATVETWKDLAPQDRRCVFLGERGECRVYDHRPIACRKHFVISPPTTCLDSHTWRWIAPFAEIVATAAYTVFGMALMAEALSEKKGEERRHGED